jgi:hypothetical protein
MLTRPNVAASKYNLALLRRQRNVTDIARQLFRECEQIYITVYGPDHSEQCTDLTTARRWMQHGKLIVVCSDTAQITKISNTTKENTCATKENTFAFSSLRMVMTAANTPRPSLS